MTETINLPAREYLRRGVVREFLGIDARDFSKLVRTGVLKPHYFQGEGYAWFKRSEVLKALDENRIFRPTRTTSTTAKAHQT